MDTRRRLILRHLVLAGVALALCACGTLRDRTGAPTPPAGAALTAADVAAPIASTMPRPVVAMAPIPNPPERANATRRSVKTATAHPVPARGAWASPYAMAGATATAAVASSPTPAVASSWRPSTPPAPPTPVSGRTAIAAANAQARATSRSEGFVDGLQVFAYAPGRVYEVWTAPLRVTTLTLAPGETVVSKAAGDTVRWQIGETTSGQGPTQRSHVMIKPLERGLETNLVLATSQRVYLIQLKSGDAESFNTAVAWDAGAALSPAAAMLMAEADGARGPDPLVAPAGPLDARFRIQPKGRRPAWTPTSVMTDGLRTFLTFPPALVASEAPALFVVSRGGEAQLVNYRQQDGLWVVDRVFDHAELRVGDKPREVVRITRQGGRS